MDWDVRNKRTSCGAEDDRSRDARRLGLRGATGISLKSACALGMFLATVFPNE